MIEIRVPSRIHISLLSLNDSLARVNGGLGFAISGFDTIVKVIESKGMELQDLRPSPLPLIEIKSIEGEFRDIARNLGLKVNAKLTICQESPPAHTGFGSGTALRLAALEAMLLLNKIEFSSDELVALSGRGATSGVGVTTYFKGGYVFDLGRKSDNLELCSSDAGRFIGKPPLVAWQQDFPNWRIGICLPYAKSVAIDDEKLLFKRICPIPFNDCAVASYHALFGVHSAILENDLLSFSTAINELQNTVWKSAEWQLHGAPIAEITDKLVSAGAEAVGLSSVGPGLYFLSKDMDSTLQCAGKSIDPSTRLFIVRPDNVGRRIVRD
ncbi:beta-ribofuranosylaminobenzene 5'-phosphate synthase family protein [Xanthomonas campestris]|uniref:beta-ribofuranosylaminobenzene 5'-phosphate synthase family protein n=1 Tax=Xanthomonas campestris TaxID=339 RepID=UPI0023EA218E|nr:beta-ribofuranosylaminobenzene 5'-phosphate synthase [Xanthomonas campestris]